MKAFAIAMVCVMVVLGSGCAQKSESEKMMDDMNKATKKMASDMKEMTK